VFAEFAQIVPEANKFHEALIKVFKKKIKRQKKKTLKVPPSPRFCHAMSYYVLLCIFIHAL
jgi:hypothetical protein